MNDKKTAIDLALTILNEVITSSTFIQPDYNNISEDDEKCENSILDIKNRLLVKLKSNGKCSELLINQLARHQCGLGEIFAIYENKKSRDKIYFKEFYQSPEILNIIENLELYPKENIFDSNNSPFKGKGISKIHHGSFSNKGDSLVINVKNYWFNKNGQLKEYKKTEFDEIYNKYISNSIISFIQAMHDKAIHSKKLTGEWLIYKRHNNINYYLCLAKHNEGDQEIYDNKILKCFQEFPELT
ncbi:MAG: hypothetical protein PHF81_04995 [Flavobacterium sp.]|nr:hypothetical protein [Flavobacterium sp.]